MSRETPERALAELAGQGFGVPPGPVRLHGYGDSEAMFRELLGLIRAGRKRAGSGLLSRWHGDG